MILIFFRTCNIVQHGLIIDNLFEVAAFSTDYPSKLRFTSLMRGVNHRKPLRGMGLSIDGKSSRLGPLPRPLPAREGGETRTPWKTWVTRPAAWRGVILFG